MLALCVSYMDVHICVPVHVHTVQKLGIAMLLLSVLFLRDTVFHWAWSTDGGQQS